MIATREPLITGQKLRKSLNSPLGCIQLTCSKSIDMLNKNTPGVEKQGQVGSTS